MDEDSMVAPEGPLLGNAAAAEVLAKPEPAVRLCCGNCGHGRAHPKPEKRICRGHPHTLLMPGTNGLELKTLYGIVPATDEGCATHSERQRELVRGVFTELLHR